MAGFFWVIAVLSMIGLLVSWSGPYAHAQDEQTKHAPSTQKNAEIEQKVTRESEGQRSGWSKYKEKIEDNEKFITATSTIFIAGFTVLLAFATFFLWLATRDLVEDAKHNAETQLRAYVFIDASQITDFFPGQRMKASLRIKNFGNTPAKKVLVGGNILFGSGNLPQAAPGKLPGVLPPSSWMEFTLKINDPITQAEYDAVVAGRSALHVKGTITYIDVFNEMRITEFSQYFAGGVPLPQGSILSLSNTEEGNDSK
jgi:hypothetical protein